MARSAAGGLLTAQHRRAQISLRASALRDYMTVWPLWDGTPGSFGSLVTAAVPVVRAHHRLSAVVASAYYQSFRAAEGAPGPSAPRLAALDEDVLAGTLYVVGRDMTRRAIAGGRSPQDAMQTALVRTAGTVSRFALAGGRDTLVSSTRADRQAAGYTRVLSPGACQFCQDIAADGAVDSDFQAHDHCGCVAEPTFT